MKVFFFDIAKQFMHVDDFSFVWIFFFFLIVGSVKIIRFLG